MNYFTREKILTPPQTPLQSFATGGNIFPTDWTTAEAPKPHQFLCIVPEPEERLMCERPCRHARATHVPCTTSMWDPTPPGGRPARSEKGQVWQRLCCPLQPPNPQPGPEDPTEDRRWKEMYAVTSWAGTHFEYN